MKNTHIIYTGNNAIDDRGNVTFVNDFTFDKVKRFYVVENFSIRTIRAFHGHKKEAKYVYVSKGSIILAFVKLDSFTNPDKNLRVNRTIISDRKPQVVYIPPGYANGFKALEPKSQVTFFSTATLEESKADDYRFPPDYWGKDIWQVDNR